MAPTPTFPPKTEADWHALVDKALKGASRDSLIAHTHDGIEIAPLYARPGDDKTTNVAIADFIAPPRRGANGTWDIRSLCVANDPATANTEILDDLLGGANSVCLQMEAPGQAGLQANYPAIATAMAGSHINMIHTGVLAGDQYIGAALALIALWDENKLTAGQRRGAINADPLGHLARTGGLEEKLYDTLRTLAHFVATNHAAWPDVTLMLADGRPYHEAGATEAEELGAMLATFVSYMRLADEDGIAPYKIMPKIDVALAADADLFMTIAKLRAARLLIARVAESCGAEMFASGVSIWTQTSERMLSTLDPHNNLLRTTTATTGAILGGADAITVLPYDWATSTSQSTSTPLGRRMARNIQIILQEECHLGRVTDPTSGSWYIDTLTRNLANKSWDVFQSLEAEKGIEEALRSGSLQDRIAKSADHRRKAIADGETAMVGTSIFQPTETKAEPAIRYSQDAPAPSDGEAVPALERLRLAEPYEQSNGAPA